MANQQDENGITSDTGASSGDDAANAGVDAAGAGGAADAGSPGGMGGAASRMPNPDHRPNGGVSPLQNSSGDSD
jgi:hypothetical protein